VQLPLVLNTLERTRKQAKCGNLDEESQDALLPAVQGCHDQIITLNEVLGKVLPEKTDGSWQRSRKANQSVRYEKKIQEISSTLQKYVQTLTLRLVLGLLKVK
jgi:predicted  nucleic acid-binding Zn-ribbon protein